MGYFAKINENNIVEQVISISNYTLQEPNLTFPDTESIGQDFILNTLNLPGIWKQTSFNSSFRGCYAGIGFSYDPNQDIFIPPPKIINSSLIDDEYYNNFNSASVIN